MKKRFLALLLALCMVFSLCIVGSAAAETAEGFTYELRGDNEVTITGYTGAQTALTVPETLDGYTVTAIASDAFYGNSSLVTVTLPDTVEYIGERAFYGCGALQSVNIPEGVEQISRWTFSGCASLSAIALPDSLLRIMKEAFSDTALTEIRIPAAVTEIGERAFYGCTSLKTVTLLGNPAIDESAFTGCTALEPLVYVQQVGSFSDVSLSDWYGAAVDWAVKESITSGTTETTFSPEQSCTRAQVVTFLWRAAGSPETDGSSAFTDVDSDAYYAAAVGWAVAQGITSGTTETSFSPEQPCTRAQVVTFLYRAAGSPETAGSTAFTDVDSGAYYAAAVGWAVAQGITSGTTETTFDPSSVCTRGQIVTFLYRAAQNTAEPEPDPEPDPEPEPEPEPSAEVTPVAMEEAGFGAALFRSCFSETENTLVSPVSVAMALTLAANGAEGDTLAEMEEVLGYSLEELNQGLKTYSENLPESEDYKLKLANSVWLNDNSKTDFGFQAEQGYLDKVQELFGAELFTAPFDNSTVTAVNDWVKEHTDSMIEEIVREFPEDTVFALVNALVFEAKWETQYLDESVKEGTFTTEAGEAQTATLMTSTEYQYLEDEYATGFLKYYEDEAYAFAALLPKEGVSLADYVSTLSDEHLQELLDNVQYYEVTATLPKFETAWGDSLNDVLQSMGMETAFVKDLADFSGIGMTDYGAPYISSVYHKTYISVTEQDTRAAAATVIIDGAPTSALVETRTVTLDRPFVYLLIDCESNTPFLIGTVVSLAE